MPTVPSTTDTAGQASSGALRAHRIFGKPPDFEALEEVIAQAKVRLPVRVLAWCVVPSQWHFARSAAAQTTTITTPGPFTRLKR